MRKSNKEFKSKDIYKVVGHVQTSYNATASDYKITKLSVMQQVEEACSFLEKHWYHDMNDYTDAQFKDVKEIIKEKKTLDEDKAKGYTKAKRSIFLGMVGTVVMGGTTIFNGKVLGIIPFPSPEEINQVVGMLKGTGTAAICTLPLFVGAIVAGKCSTDASRIRLSEEKNEKFKNLFETKEELIRGRKSVLILRDMINNFANDKGDNYLLKRNSSFKTDFEKSSAIMFNKKFELA